LITTFSAVVVFGAAGFLPIQIELHCGCEFRCVRHRSFSVSHNVFVAAMSCRWWLDTGYDGGKLKYMGKVRAGFVPHIRCALLPLLQKLFTEKCPFADLPEKRRTLYSLTKDEMQNCHG
jgi:hypothetical protein